jgi:hypothetical protein
MPRIPGDDEVKEGGLIHPAQYMAEVILVNVTDKDGHLKQDRHGNEMWSIKLEILDGKQYGSFVWDNITFSAALKSRTKAIFNAFGFDTSKGLDVNDPNMLVGRKALIDIEIKNYEGKDQNKVKFFGGYHLIGEHDQEKEEEMPF